MTTKIINGKRYDTEISTRIADCGASCARTDFHWWKETLYRTPQGRFFLEGTGGPMTRWARTVGQNSPDVGGIRALTDDEARAWVEKYANDQYAGLFPAEAA